MILRVMGFPKILVSQNGWFIMETSIKMDDLGFSPYFWVDTHIYIYFPNPKKMDMHHLDLFFFGDLFTDRDLMG